MSTKSESEAHLRHMDIKVRDMCDDLDPKLIIEYPGSAPTMYSELLDISHVLLNYKSDHREFLRVHASELTEEEVSLWHKGLQKTEEVVEAHKLAVVAAVNQVLPPSMLVPEPMTQFQKEILKIMEKRLELDIHTDLFSLSLLGSRSTIPPTHVPIREKKVVSVTHQAVPQLPGLVLGELQHLGVQAVTNQAVLQSPMPLGQPVFRALGEPQLLGVQAVTHQAVPQQPGRVLGELQHMGVQAVTNQAVLQSPMPPGQPVGHALGEPQLLGVQAVTNQAVLQSHHPPGHPAGSALGEVQHLGVQPGCVTVKPATRSSSR